MVKKLLILSAVCNLVLLAVVVFHWQQIGLRYSIGSVPPLSCYQLSSGYIAAHEDIFSVSDQVVSQGGSEAEWTPEQAKAFRQSVFVQDTAQEIEKLCSQEIGDFTEQSKSN